MRNKLLVNLAVIFFILLISSSNQAEIDNLNSQIADLQSELDDCNYELEEATEKLSTLEDYTTELGSELDDLKSEIDDFTWEDWQSNVWDIESEMSDEDSAFDNLQYEF